VSESVSVLRNAVSSSNITRPPLKTPSFRLGPLIRSLHGFASRHDLSEAPPGHSPHSLGSSTPPSGPFSVRYAATISALFFKHQHRRAGDCFERIVADEIGARHVPRPWPQAPTEIPRGDGVGGTTGARACFGPMRQATRGLGREEADLGGIDGVAGSRTLPKR